MKTKILFVLFLLKNRVLFNYLKSLSHLHVSIHEVWSSYTPEFWIMPTTFEYFYRKRFKVLDKEWRMYHAQKIKKQ